MSLVHLNRVNSGERLLPIQSSGQNLVDLLIMKRSREIAWPIPSPLIKSLWSAVPTHGTQFYSLVFALNPMFRSQLHCNSLASVFFLAEPLHPSLIITHLRLHSEHIPLYHNIRTVSVYRLATDTYTKGFEINDISFVHDTL